MSRQTLSAGTPRRGLAAAIVGIALVAANLAAGLAGIDFIGGLYVWRDVALVYGLASLPLAALAADWLAGRPLSVLRLLAPGGGLAAAGLLSFWPAGAVSPEALTLTRLAAAWAGTCGAIAVVSQGLAAWSRRRASGEAPPERTAAAAPGWLAAAIAGAVLVAVPWTYRAARTRDDLRRLEELAAQSRLGEALALAAATRELDPRAEFAGRPLAHTVAELERAVTEIAVRASAPLAAQDDPEPYLARARDLAILGRTDLALAALDAAPRGEETPAGDLLRGTIYESRGQWARGRAAYQRARDIISRQCQWQLADQPADRSPPAEATAVLVQATSGMAFCQRKAGDYTAAAESYAELLALAPTAETHFLLAQFYEDAQATALAQQHARRAMELAPERFGARGQILLDKLRTGHFGCWGVGSSR